MRYVCDINLIREINHVVLPWKFLLPEMEEREMTRHYYDCYWGGETHGVFLTKVRLRLTTAQKCILSMRRLLSIFRHWYQNKVLGQGRIIARNRKERLPDRVYTVKYHPIWNEYFTAAFSGKFERDLENGAYVIHVSKMGTSQDVIEKYCEFTFDMSNGRRIIHDFLDASSHSLSFFEQRFSHLQVLADQFMDSRFASVCASFLNNYIDETLLKMKNMNSTQRLERFIRQNAVIAEYIWKGNFSSPAERESLGVQLHISKRNLGGFKKATSLAELREYVDRKMDKKDTLLDQLPPHLWKRIQDAEEALRDAQDGVRIGLFGRYISSDKIEACRSRLRQAWRDADVWIGQKLLRESGA